MLEHWNGGLRWHEIELNSNPFKIEGIDGLQITPVVLTGKAPPYSPGSDTIAIVAITIPLRKAPAGSRAEDVNFHV